MAQAQNKKQSRRTDSVSDNTPTNIQRDEDFPFEFDQMPNFKQNNITQYRKTTIGKTLIAALGELVTKNKIPDDLSSKILVQFDRCVMRVFLKQKLATKARLTFKASELCAYHYEGGTWSLILKNVEFREIYSFVNVNKIKILAFEPSYTPNPARKRSRNEYTVYKNTNPIREDKCEQIRERLGSELGEKVITNADYYSKRKPCYSSEK